MDNLPKPAVAPKSVFAALSVALFPYRVFSPLNHNNVEYGIGAEVEMTAAQAEPLLGHTVLRVE